MEIFLKEADNNIMEVTIDDDFIVWLGRNTEDLVPSIMDAYQDRVLHDHQQIKLLKSLDELIQQIRMTRYTYYTKTTRLPSNPDARQTILDKLIQRDMKSNIYWNNLEVIKTMVEIAIASQMTIHCIGD